jgi:hypothetical protein
VGFHEKIMLLYKKIQPICNVEVALSESCDVFDVPMKTNLTSKAVIASGEI